MGGSVESAVAPGEGVGTLGCSVPRLREARPGEGDLVEWTVELSADASPLLQDHCLKGIPTVPGAILIGHALAAARHVLGTEPRLLLGIEFQRMLVLRGHEPQAVRIIVAPSVDGSRTIHIFSGTDADGDARRGELPNASVLLPTQSPEGTRRAGDRVAPDDVKRRCPEKLSASDFYASLRAGGNEYGPTFQGVKRLWRGDGEALAALSVPSSARAPLEGVELEPVLLDAACQVLLATDNRLSNSTFVLLGIDELRLYQSPSARCWAYAFRHPNTTAGDELIGDVRLMDAAGHALADVLGVRFASVSADRSTSAASEPVRMQIAVASTFTAEPLEDSLAFWMRKLGHPAEIHFSPYNQLFQQLLDPASLLSSNTDGLNVILIRFEDWLPAAMPLALQTDPGERERLLAGRDRYTLPNHLEIAHLNAFETEYLYEEIFEHQVYLRHGITLNNGDYVVDVGANIGLFTLFVSEICPNAHIFAFEPSPIAFEVLRSNAALYCPNASVFDCGVADRVGDVEFTSYRNSTVLSGFHADPTRDEAAMQTVIRNMVRQRTPSGGQPPDALLAALTETRLESQTELRPVRTLQDVIAEQQIERIDLLKIDAEGDELAVLQGIGDNWSKIRQIVLEVHDLEGQTTAAIASLLQEQGFTIALEQEEALHGTGFSIVYASRPAPQRPGSLQLARSTTALVSLEQNLDHFFGALRTARKRSAASYMVVLCPASPGALRNAAKKKLIAQLEERLSAELATIDGVCLIRPSELLDAYPVADVYDARADSLGHVPYTPRFFTALGSMVARRYHVLIRPPYKVIAVDADQTLWSGVCGEDGATGVQIDAPRQELQAFLLEQQRNGMLLCLCSKNDEADVSAVFERHPEMRLGRDHFVSWRVNWRLKSENLQSIARELKLGLDSFVVIDDDPIERAEIQSACPEALVLDLPRDANAIPHVLQHVWALDHLRTTEEDSRRPEAYRQESLREELRKTALTFDEFLESLSLVVRIAAPTSEELPRVAQLTQRVNQFNFTAVRRSEPELRSLLETGALECLGVHVRDRFGDYGLVGAMLFESGPEALVVDTFLLSCRALGRGVEHQMMAALGQLARERGLTRLDVQFTTNGRNQPAIRFVEELQALLSPTSAGPAPGPPTNARSIVRLEAELLTGLTYRPVAGGDRELGSLSVLDRTRIPAEREPQNGSLSTLISHIATELNSVDQIFAAVEAAKRRPKVRTPRAPLAPGSELERAIRDIWEQVLGIEDVGIDDNFFELGGKSLDAVLVASELHHQLGIDISSIELFAGATVSTMASMLSAEGEVALNERMQASRQRGERRRARSRGRPWRR